MSYYNKKKTFVYKTITSLCSGSTLHEPENKGVINRLKSFFGVRKTVSKFKKISVTPEEFLKKSMKVSVLLLELFFSDVISSH
jgi:hypothetical protein